MFNNDINKILNKINNNKHNKLKIYNHYINLIKKYLKFIKIIISTIKRFKTSFYSKI